MLEIFICYLNVQGRRQSMLLFGIMAVHEIFSIILYVQQVVDFSQADNEIVLVLIAIAEDLRSSVLFHVLVHFEKLFDEIVLHVSLLWRINTSKQHNLRVRLALTAVSVSI